jgi:antitoxin MazE
MRSPVRKMGNSAGVIIPKALLQQLGVEAGDDLEMSLEQGRLILEPTNRNPREGWAEAAQRIAESGEDTLAWPEFGTEYDSELQW